MSLWTRLAAAAQALVGVRAEVPATNTITTSRDLEEAWLWQTAHTAAGQTVTPKIAYGLSDVYTAIRIIRTAIAHLPLVLLERINDRVQPAVGHPLYGLLHDAPNEWQTAMEYREILQTDVELRGNHYSLIVRGMHGPVELIRFHPDVVKVKQDPRTWRVEYEITKPDGTRVTYPQDRIFHVRGCGDNGVTGVSPITLQRETLGDALALRQHGSMFFSNGAKPLAALEWDTQGGIKPELSSDARKDLKEDFESTFAGGQNAHKTIGPLPFGLKYKQISISLEDAQYIESRKFSSRQIFAMYGVPPHKAGDLDKATFSNIEHQSLEFVIDAVTPRAVRLEQAISRCLLEPGERRVLFPKHNLSALLRGDAKSRAEALAIQRRNGIISANEWRELEDLNPRDDEGGDLYIRESNMQPDDRSTPNNPPAPGGDS